MRYDTIYTSKIRPEECPLHSGTHLVRRYGDRCASTARLHVFWGNQGYIEPDGIKADHNVHVEIGYFEHGDLPRGELRSIAVDGFGGSGDFYRPDDSDPVRPFPDLEPLVPESDKTMIILQKYSDAAVDGANMTQWVNQCLHRYGEKNCIIRPHPVHGTTLYQLSGTIDHIADLRTSLQMNKIGRVATYSSSTAIKTIAMGYHTHVEHDYGFAPEEGESREEWARRYSYRVWTKQEFQKGLVRQYLDKYLEEQL